ncbi:MAG TPA: NAD-binding protein, partial [Isosphaeraceae bacterium]|nr:NAD-binding protein [Isosphaeraceae bacterium]
ADAPDPFENPPLRHTAKPGPKPEPVSLLIAPVRAPAIGDLPPVNGPSRLRIAFRYLHHLVWEFRWPLVVFWSIVLGGGLVLHLLYSHDHQGLSSYGEACYAIFMLIFLESYLSFPDEWYLQPFFFILPVIGLGAVADSIIRLAYLVFSRKQRLPEWQRMVASLYRNHVVVVGMGNVGYQIVKGLLAMREPVVVVERPSADSTLLDEIIDLNIPVIRGDGRSNKTLETAGVRWAKAVILSTSDDLTNLDAGLTARDLSSTARIVLRLFDESLAEKVGGAFAMPAISTSQVAAPAFVAAATGRKIYQDFQLAGKHLYLIDMTVAPECALTGRSIGEIQADKALNVVMHSGREGVSVNPGPEIHLQGGDVLLVIAPMERLLEFEAMNRPPEMASSGVSNGPARG